MTQQNHYLVIGGTGKTGRKVAEGLQQLDQVVRIGSRSSDPVFDWTNQATWPTALEGMDKIYITYYPDLAVPGALDAIKGLTEAAKKAGIKKVVLLSGKGEKEAERSEQVVANSGLDYTLVRASWFSQNFSESFLLDPILAGYVALPMPNAKIPFVDTTDIAEVVVKALVEEGHNGKTYEITGPRALTFEEVVQEISVATGKDIQYQAVTLEAYNAMMKGAGVPADYIWLFDYLFREVLSKDENQVVSNDVEKVLGRKAIDFKDYVQRTMQTGVWDQIIPQSI
ncbi:MAG: NmrA family NAD(P)-binding protein [Bacteroidota bacterium]